jgi:hypothetical protein
MYGIVNLGKKDNNLRVQRLLCLQMAEQSDFSIVQQNSVNTANFWGPKKKLCNNRNLLYEGGNILTNLFLSHKFVISMFVIFKFCCTLYDTILLWGNNDLRKVIGWILLSLQYEYS